MDAGRELDALVAERVMGWTINGGCWCDDGRLTGWASDDPACEGDDPRFNPSENIAAAWEVVNKIGQAECSSPVWVICIPGKGWIAGMGHGESEFTAFAPLTICLAALKSAGAVT